MVRLAQGLFGSFFHGLRHPGKAALSETVFSRRHLALTGFIGLAFAVATLRLGYFVLDESEAGWAFWQRAEAIDRPQTLAALQPVRHRAQILGAQGQILANNIKVKILCHRPGQVEDPRAAAQTLAAIIPGADPEFLERRLRGTHPWLRYEVTPSQAQDIHEAYIQGIVFCPDQRRAYPHGALFAHPLGFTGADNQGLAGMELRLNLQIQNSAEPLQTSLDATVQGIVMAELAAQIERFEALGGVAILMRVDTAEVVSLVSLPTFDPNQVVDVNAPGMFNRATMGVYELGSVMKPFTIAAALNDGLVDVDTQLEIAQSLEIDQFEIEDFPGTPKGVLTVAEIVQYSSNIGTAQIAAMLGPERQQFYLREFGLIRPVDLEVAEIAPPLVPHTWRETETMTVAYGHGISVTPLQLVAAEAALVNGGLYRRPTLLATQGQDRAATRVIDAHTSDLTRSLLRRVAVFGSGRAANAKGYVIGGKTGTAEKSAAGGYNNDARISSFLGAFPIHDPAYVLLVSIDGPKPQEWTFGHATGGWVAAPVFGRIVERIGPYLGIERLHEDPYGYEVSENAIASATPASPTAPISLPDPPAPTDVGESNAVARNAFIESLIAGDGILF